MMNNDDTSNKKPNLLFISDIPLETSEPAQEVVKPEKPEKEKQTEEKFAFLIPKPNPEFDMPDEIIAENSAPNVCVSEKEPVLQKPTNKQELSKDIEKAPFKGKKNLLKKFIRWLLFWGLIACIFIGLLLAGFVYIIKRNIPDFSSLKDYDPPVTTQVFDARKNVIAEFFYQRRFVKPLPLIPKRLIQAFISAEDARFYQHEGYDIKSIIRAFIKNVVAGRIVQGGSTITQQTARSFLTTRHKSYLRKLQEVILAYQLEQTFSKDHILFLYLNQIYLGYGAYGVEAASQNYFGKSINQMTLAECAALAGLPQAPARYAPDKNFSAFKARQKYVLKRMYNEGYITENDARQAFKQPLNIQPRKNHFTDNAPYFSEHVRIELENCLGAESLYNDGLRIYTTVDMQIQSTAQKALNNGLKAIEKRHNYPENTPRLQGALICMDLRNGHIKALVGGRDFSQSKFNRAVQAIRQPGSSFKPIIYSAALDAGFTAASIIIDAPIVMKDDEHDFVWKPDNYEKTFYGPTTLRRALALSRNLVTIKLLQKVGVEKVIDYARQLGITSPIQKDLSIALGSSGVSLIELIRAYAVFASGGFLIEPACVVKVESQLKESIMCPSTKEKKQVIEASTAYCMTHMLQAVVQQGTAHRLKQLNRPIAGKTGSTNNLYDAWFIGYTPRYITGVWVGFDQPRSIGEKETGARAAIPIWMSFMKEVLGGKKGLKFATPPGVFFSKIDADTGTLPTPKTKHIVFECFKEGTRPNPIQSSKSDRESQDSFFKHHF